MHPFDINNHIHTTFSFSPYSPEQAVTRAKEAGLCTAGIMDHDSLAGARAFIEAGRAAGLPTTIGMECRTSMAGTLFANLRLNNPDQTGIAYVALHGVPHTRIDAVTAFMVPYRAARERRNRDMTLRLRSLVSDFGLSVDYDRDVLPLSEFARGGSVTERHILFAVALQIAADGDPAGLLARLPGVSLSDRQRALLSEPCQFLAYDILGVLKSSLIDRVYLPAGEECPPIGLLAEFCRDNGIVLAYAYLGDVTDSVTGDKKAQRFEDAFLDELVAALPGLGFVSVTYMPSRNSGAQLDRLQALCAKHELFQICGEDINSPRQSFLCPQLREPSNAHLADAAWALIGHEQAATEALTSGMFSAETIARMPRLADRAAYFAELARRRADDCR